MTERHVCVHLDDEARIRVLVDTWVNEHDALNLCRFPSTVPLWLCIPDCALEEQWRQIPQVMGLAILWPQQQIFPADHFQPYFDITVTSKQVMHDEHELLMGKIVGYEHPDHEQRVKALCSAWDALQRILARGPG